MSHARVREIERQRAEALEGLRRAIEDDFNAVQDAHWFSWADCHSYVALWIDSELESKHLAAMANGTPQQLHAARKALQKEVDRMVEQYALEEGQFSINLWYDNILEDLANG